MSRHTRVFPSATAVLIMLVVMSAQLRAAQVQLTWTAPSANADGTALSDLAGYRVYYGQTSGNLSQNVDVGNQTAYLLSGLVGGQVYYFAVTAYDTSGNLSALSNEVSATTSTDPLPPPVASFTGSPTTGSAPLTVTFTDTSTGQVTTWAWTFGDSSGSSAQHPQHTYASAGTYTVTLTVNGPGGYNTATKQSYITVSVPPPPSSGLVAAYSFNEGMGSTVTDASGKGNHGTRSGAQWTNSGRYGKALVFDGIDDRVTVANSPSLQSPNTAITVSAWIRPNGSSQVWSSVVHKVNSTNYVSYGFGQNESYTRRFSGYLQVNGVGYTTAITKAMTNLTWYFVVLTWQCGQQVTLTIYNANGSIFHRVTTTQAPAGMISYDASPLLIGEDEAGDNWKGRIDEVRIYNRTLTPSQIQTDMNTPVSSTGGAALVRLTPLATRVREAPRDRTGPARSTAVNLAKSDARAKPTLRQRGTTELSEASSQAQPHLVEAGEVQVTPQWQRVEFNEAFADPIVIANAVSSNGGAPALIGIRHVEPTGFEIRLQQMMDASRTGLSAVAGFLVLERGTYTLADGTLMEAGRVTTTPSGTSLTVPFSRRFNRIPVVMTSVISANEMDPVMSRIQSVKKNDLHVELHGGGSVTHASDMATLVYIALEPSAGTLQGMTFEAQRAYDIAPGQWHALAFPGAFDAPPVLLAEVQGSGSGHSLTLRWDAKRADGVEVTIDAELHGDDAPDAPVEVVGYIELY